MLVVEANRVVRTMSYEEINNSSSIKITPSFFIAKLVIGKLDLGMDHEVQYTEIERTICESAPQN